MNVQAQTEAYINSLPEAKQKDMQALQQLLLRVLPEGKRWFFDGTNEAGKVVSNPTIGYGAYTITYANGETREFFQVGLSPNKTGISVHIMGIDDKTYLPRTYSDTLGKASISGYCIRFKALKDIDAGVLEAAIRYGISCSTGK